MQDYFDPQNVTLAMIGRLMLEMREDISKLRTEMKIGFDHVEDELNAIHSDFTSVARQHLLQGDRLRVLEVASGKE